MTIEKVLIIDDEKSRYDELSSELVAHGYNPIPEYEDIGSNSFRDLRLAITNQKVLDFALKRIEEEYQNLVGIICDYDLGRGSPSGLDIIKAIRQYDFSSEVRGFVQKIPIFFHTGTSNPSVITRARNLGAIHVCKGNSKKIIDLLKNEK